MEFAAECKAATELFEDFTLLTSLIISQTIVFIVFLSLSTVFIISLKRSSNIHCNCRLLLSAIALGADIFVFSELGKTIYYQVLIREALSSSRKEDLCEFVTTTSSVCSWIQSPSRIGHTVMATALPMLAVERILATVFCTTYEKSRRIRLYGLLLIVLQVVLSLARLPIFPWSLTSNRTAVYCIDLLMRDDSCGWIIIHLCLQIIAFLIFLALNRYNMHIMPAVRETSAPSAVSTRYQINENLKITKFLYILSIIQIIATLYSVYNTWAAMYDLEREGMDGVHLMRDKISASSLLIIVPTACVLLGVMLLQKTIRVNTVKLLRLDQVSPFKNCCVALPARRYRVSDSTTLANTTQQSYFAALEKQWDIPPSK
ncbi:hypothetical protein Tcan_18798 [Toxocara canis]|uniref:Serpentine receptor class alpha/beta-14 n=2 Tax=Toxocara canis TaxID=6265 RepID=A0A0B2VWK1_TOXCA|nr:hypothetical protein Tcan_18798 [Toxocara canis]VDM40611.1 unnamed protein product [Toxocara canis]